MTQEDTDTPDPVPVGAHRKVGLALLTDEKRKLLQAAWDSRASGILLDKAGQPRYAGLGLETNEALKTLIQSAFEGLISAFAEHSFPHPEPDKANQAAFSQHIRAHMRDVSIINRYVEQHIRAKIEPLIPCEDADSRVKISRALTGSIITRAISSFHSVFPVPKYEQVGVEDYALDDSGKYFKSPRGDSRYSR